jgi:hypothetical protein
MDKKDTAMVERIKYMTGALAKNAAALNAEMQFQKGKISHRRFGEMRSVVHPHALIQV